MAKPVKQKFPWWFYARHKYLCRSLSGLFAFPEQGPDLTLDFLIFFQFAGVKSDSQADVSALIVGVNLPLHSPLSSHASTGESKIAVQNH